jgi:hypothetical protein
VAVPAFHHLDFTSIALLKIGRFSNEENHPEVTNGSYHVLCASESNETRSPRSVATIASLRRLDTPTLSNNAGEVTWWHQPRCWHQPCCPGRPDAADFGTIPASACIPTWEFHGPSGRSIGRSVPQRPVVPLIAGTVQSTPSEWMRSRTSTANRCDSSPETIIQNCCAAQSAVGCSPHSSTRPVWCPGRRAPSCDCPHPVDAPY